MTDMYIGDSAYYAVSKRHILLSIHRCFLLRGCVEGLGVSQLVLEGRGQLEV